MLTTTYALTAIAIEQKKTYHMLLGLMQDIQSANWNKNQLFDLNYSKMMLDKFMQFDQCCHSRKLEMYMIPSIREATLEMNALLDELDALSNQAISIINSLYEQSSSFVANDKIGPDTLYLSMDRYCQNLLKRLIREEKELFPMAQRLLPFNTWFGIAVQCLSQDTKNESQQCSGKPIPPDAPAENAKHIALPTTAMLKAAKDGHSLALQALYGMPETQ
jgi:hemerythrin-like domain-containing protein